MKYLITGSAGFIGKNLTNHLKANNHSVIHLHHEYFLSRLLTILRDHKNIDYIIHLSAYGNHSSQKESVLTYRANVADLQDLLNYTLDYPYKALLNISSSSVYGKKYSPMREIDLLEPETMYAATKAAGEMLVRGYAYSFNKPIVNIRPASVYGPYEGDHRFIPTIIRSLLTDTTMTLDGSGVHDWIYIDSFISALHTIIENADILKGEAINVGTGKQRSNKEVVEIVESLMDKKLSIAEYKTLRPNDSPCWTVKSDTLQSYGWFAKETLEEGLRKTINHYEKHYT